MITNNSGIKPVGISILVLPDQVEQTTESGIVLSTHDQHAREEMGQTDGLVVEISPFAYYDEKTPRCQVGDRVVMAKYAGMVRVGNDGLTYRLIKDNDVIALLEKGNKDE
jgi:co-chaperonin GroES (HSP10)